MLPGQNNRISTAVLASALLTMSLSAAHANDVATSAVGEGTGHCAHYALPAFPDLTPIAGADGTHSVISPFGEVELPTNPAASLGMYTTDIDILIAATIIISPSPASSRSRHWKIPRHSAITPNIISSKFWSQSRTSS
jgi:hypothetical protein